MKSYAGFSTPRKRWGWPVLLAVVWMSESLAGQATNASFAGTYTMVFGSEDFFSLQFNMFNQEVGFCSNGNPQLPFGYYCNGPNLGQSVLTGTLVADGLGHVVTGSTYVFSPDPNESQCSAKYNAAPDCPYKVPFGTVWNSSTNYVVGDEADFTVNGVLETFQAVKNSTNVAPNTSLCTATIQPPNCAWDQLHLSATGNKVQNGTLTGTYLVQSNGSTVMQVTPSGNGGKPVSFAMVVPSAPLAIGQEVPMAAMSTLANQFRGSGASVRIK